MRAWMEIHLVGRLLIPRVFKLLALLNSHDAQREGKAFPDVLLAIGIDDVRTFTD